MEQELPLHGIPGLPLVRLTLVDMVDRTYKITLAGALGCQPTERLLEVVVGFGGDVVVLQVLLAVESDGLCFDFALLHVDLVAAEDYGGVRAHAGEVT